MMSGIPTKDSLGVVGVPGWIQPKKYNFWFELCGLHGSESRDVGFKGFRV